MARKGYRGRRERGSRRWKATFGDRVEYLSNGERRLVEYRAALYQAKVDLGLMTQDEALTQLHQDLVEYRRWQRWFRR
ncbi:MAG TPA: hypothetical protein ENI37_08485 [Chloroflexi bacterium]|nr:hypothetical protein [Chloroflexota bacterium]